ncbi:hypothetical protein WG8_1739 [Paenibacillus sp. Aloe-11]|nr:hypothetical protein WG8_1739 [Paenibacillus sp. Aloe-11]
MRSKRFTCSATRGKVFSEDAVAVEA